jgi:hypothetical protein
MGHFSDGGSGRGSGRPEVVMDFSRALKMPEIKATQIPGIFSAL